MSEGPLVSVVIPTYYRNDLLEKTIESVLEQTYAPIEVIVVDDSGDRHAEETVSSFEAVRYLESPGFGNANAARTLGASEANGEFVHFLDDDDIMFPEKVEKQVSFLLEYPTIGVCYSGILVSQNIVHLPRELARDDVLVPALQFEMWPCMTSTMLIRRSILKQMLPLPRLEAGQDLAMMIDLACLTPFGYVAEPLLEKRLDAGSLGSSMAAIDGRLQIIEDYDDQYAAQPESVRRRALANTYETKAAHLLNQGGWSVAAIRALWLHRRFEPERRFAAYAKLCAGLLGRRGWHLLKRLNRVTTKSITTFESPPNVDTNSTKLEGVGDH